MAFITTDVTGGFLDVLGVCSSQKIGDSAPSPTCFCT